MTRIHHMTQIALCTALLTICAYITVPAVIPFTLQSFGVALTLLLLGKRGAVAVLLYLALGITGLPVFAGFRGGIGVLFSITGGYLLGFAAQAGLFALCARRHPLAVLSAGLPLSYAVSTAWITLLYAEGRGIGWTLVTCILPYVLPDILKLLAAVWTTKRLQHLRLFR